tara:strand:- start:189 stop:716 length:528 start_codon:yes stop_codon:yes gene_type:complete
MSEGKIVTIVNDKNQTKSMEDTLKVMKREWTRKNLAVEIATMQGQRFVGGIQERKLKNYATSTTNRRGFLQLIIQATYDELPILANQLGKQLDISRPALNTMINECLEENWIYLVEDSFSIKEKKKQRKMFYASDFVIKSYERYTEWVYQILTKTGIRSITISIDELERMLQHQT